MTIFTKVLIDSLIDYEINLSNEDIEKNPKILNYVRNNLVKIHEVLNKMSLKDAMMFRVGILKSILNNSYFKVTDEYRLKIQNCIKTTNMS